MIDIGLDNRTYITALRVAALLFILTHGEPDLIGAIVAFIGRVAG